MTDTEILLVKHEARRWSGMKDRCKNDPIYAGIKVCEEWQGDEGFIRYYRHVSQLEHFGEKGYSLDRIDVYGDYEPGNVRWATKETQSRNRRCVIRDDGQTLEDISKETGIPVGTLRERYFRGDRGKRLRRSSDRKRFVDRGQVLEEVSKETNIKCATLRRRYRSGDRGERLRRPIGTEKSDYPNE